jgi:type IV secretory pathway TraG/TraD family ATPase VirD4
MDGSKILIVNLSKGKIGEDNANFLGSLIVSDIVSRAMKRAYQKEKDRVYFYMFIDEFQNFTTDSFASIVSEARKYRLSLNIAHQNFDRNRSIDTACLKMGF